MKQCLHYKGKKCKIILFCRTLIFKYFIRSLKHNFKCQQLQNANIDTKIHLPFFTIKFKCSLKTSVLDKENMIFYTYENIRCTRNIFLPFYLCLALTSNQYWLKPDSQEWKSTLEFLESQWKSLECFLFFCFSIFDCASLSINYDTWLHGRIYGIKLHKSFWTFHTRNWFNLKVSWTVHWYLLKRYFYLQAEAPYFSCDCETGYTGYVCDTQIDYCSNLPCQNDANCTSTLTGYTCACKTGKDTVKISLLSRLLIWPNTNYAHYFLRLFFVPITETFICLHKLNI